MRQCSPSLYIKQTVTQEKESVGFFPPGVGEYLELEHAEKVPSQELSEPAFSTFYLPMHGVVKEESTTTKLRIVFDGSGKTSTGNSLNDTLLPGSSLYPLLHTVINKFRTHRIGMSCDISKMFREVALLSEDYDLHRLTTSSPPPHRSSYSIGRSRNQGISPWGEDVQVPKESPNCLSMS